MVLFEYEIKESALNGLGVFTKENIKKGKRLFQASPKLDTEISAEEFEKLDDREKREFIHYGYLDKRVGTYKLDFSVALRFLNFSKNGNCNQDPDVIGTCLTANRDIKAGEEITFNYFEVMNEEHFQQGFNPK